jgi:hypothetical protein
VSFFFAKARNIVAADGCVGQQPISDTFPLPGRAACTSV